MMDKLLLITWAGALRPELAHWLPQLKAQHVELALLELCTAQGPYFGPVADVRIQAQIDTGEPGFLQQQVDHYLQLIGPDLLHIRLEPALLASLKLPSDVALILDGFAGLSFEAILHRMPVLIPRSQADFSLLWEHPGLELLTCEGGVNALYHSYQALSTRVARAYQAQGILALDRELQTAYPYSPLLLEQLPSSDSFQALSFEGEPTTVLLSLLNPRNERVQDFLARILGPLNRSDLALLLVIRSATAEEAVALLEPAFESQAELELELMIFEEADIVPAWAQLLDVTDALLLADVPELALLGAVRDLPVIDLGGWAEGQNQIQPAASLATRRISAAFPEAGFVRSDLAAARKATRERLQTSYERLSQVRPK